MNKLKVRYLLRVSSDKQLDADGDLTVQRNIVRNYIDKHDEWELDKEGKSEYYEGGMSAYKNTMEQREIMTKIKEDAKKKEFNILVCYKDDRIGRRGNETLSYVKELKSCGVLIYTVKEDLITPMDHEGELLGFLKFWNAEKSSRDTGQRVSDTLKELVKQGKFVGGKAPYGYELVLSGELSKHQRALKKPQIVQEKAEMVKKIFYMATRWGFGSYKIAKELNQEEEYRRLSPNGSTWKNETVRSILMNPIYTGYIAYNRRTHKGEHYKTLDRENWIYSNECNDGIKIIDLTVWELAQQMREERKEKIAKSHESTGHESVTTTGRLPLIDVAYCGYCGRKMTNGSKYNYWVTKEGEKRRGFKGKYRCQTKQQSEPCGGKSLHNAEDVEPIVFEAAKEYLAILENRERVIEKVKQSSQKEQRNIQEELRKAKIRVKEIQRDIDTLKDNIPKVLRGEIAITMDILNGQLKKEEERKQDKLEMISKLEQQTKEQKEEVGNLDDFMKSVPTWREAFDSSDGLEKRIIINKIIERIDIKEDEIKIRYKINIDTMLSRIATNQATILCRHGSA